MASSELAVECDDERIDEIFAALDQCRLPGTAVGIAIGGRPVYRKAFGLASMELPMVLTTATRMRLGSTTKHLAALACLLLCEEGKARIDEPIGKYLPELHPACREVTLRQLMGNVGGLRDACDFSLRFGGSGQRITNADILACYQRIHDVNAAPGTAWIYNNGGYVLLSVAMERISGQPLEQLLRERIFTPLGMHDTLLRRFDTDFVANSASLHMTNASGGYERAHFGIDFAGAGAIVSTVDDMLRWLAHMEVPTVGTAATWSALKTPLTLANGASTGYGLGLMVGRYRGVATISHPGGGMGSNAQMLKVPGAKLDVVVLVNRHDVLSMQLASQILDACLPGLAPIDETARGAPACGTFRSPVTGRVVQLFGKDRQQIVSIDGFDLPFVREAGGRLRPAQIWGFLKRVVTLLGDPREPASIRLDDFGNLDELVRMKAPEGVDPGDALGRYRSATAEAQIVIQTTGHGPQLIATGRFGSAPYDLECLAAGIWRARPATPMNLGGIVTFDEDGAGLRFFSYGTRALPFRRLASR